ncbi:MAG: tetratricopeptide repeat protein [Vicinamibacterales bacterium]
MREAQALEDDPRSQVEMLHTLGLAYEGLGDLASADRLLTDALARSRTRLADQPADTVGSLVALSELRLDQARLDEADALAREALDVSAARLPPDAPVALAALTALGRVQRDKGDYQAAIATLASAVERYGRQDAERLPFTDALAALSETYYYVGDMAAAERLSQQALDATRRLRGPNHPDVGHALLNLGAVSASRGERADAERQYRDALAILSRWFGDDHPETASAMTILAQLLGQQAPSTEAAGLLQRAIAVQARTFGERHPRTAFVQNELGMLAFRSEDYAAARQAFEQAVDGYGSSEGTHFQQAISLANLGSVSLATGDNRAAEQAFRQSLEIYAGVLPDDHLNVAISRSKLGRALVRQGRREEAAPFLARAEAVLRGQPGPESSWLKATREDLAILQQAPEPAVPVQR